MNEFLSQYGVFFLYIGGVSAIFIGVAIFNYKKMKNTTAKFLTENPNASKVFLTTKGFITSEAVTVHTVNDTKPILFTDKGKSGFYSIPGDVKVEISYSYTRPGIMYKTVTTSTDMVTKVLKTEPNKSYLLGFNRKEESFTFEEILN